jgi:transposase
MPVMIGVDPHKATHTAAALDEHGRLLGQQCIPATLDGYRTLRGWAARWPDRRWAVEGAHGTGRALASGWSATASAWWTCRPSWPPGCG